MRARTRTRRTPLRRRPARIHTGVLRAGAVRAGAVRVAITPSGRRPRCRRRRRRTPRRRARPDRPPRGRRAPPCAPPAPRTAAPPTTGRPAGPQQRAALPLGHPAPHAELDPVVQRVREALRAHRARPAELARLALPRARHEQPLGVGRPAPRRRPPVPPARHSAAPLVRRPLLLPEQECDPDRRILRPRGSIEHPADLLNPLYLIACRHGRASPARVPWSIVKPPRHLAPTGRLAARVVSACGVLVAGMAFPGASGGGDGVQRGRATV